MRPLRTYRSSSLSAERMDTLVCTATMFIIPINIAAIRGKYVLMNVYVGLALTSWAHHGITHELSRLGRTTCVTTYNRIDLTMCYSALAYTFVYSLMYTNRLQWFLYCMCFLIDLYHYYMYVNTNKFYYVRGIENWRLHKSHILIHLSTCIGFTAIAL